MTTSFTFRRQMSRKTERLMRSNGQEFTNRLAREMRTASHTIGGRAVQIMTREVRGGIGAPNTQMTLKLKSGNRPGHDTGRLADEIAYRVRPGPRADSYIEVGLIDGLSDAEVIRYGRLVHGGFTINVTPRMQNMFNLLRKHTSQDWAYKGRKPPPPLTSARARALFDASSGNIPDMQVGHRIVVRARPFSLAVARNRELQAVMRTQYTRAVKRALQ